jgi:hypothetical protein
MSGPGQPKPQAGGAGEGGESDPAETAARQDSPAAAFELPPLGYSEGGAPVRLFRFPGRAEGASGDAALILGGVHGSERSGVEVAWRAIARLADGAVPPRTVYAVPCLFPDNHAVGLREGSVPTNRNFPWPGESMARAGQRGLEAGRGGTPLDSLGVPILPENRILLGLIGRIKPARLVSLHATVYPQRAGIFADPHGLPALFDPEDWARLAEEAAARTMADIALATAMARHAAGLGAGVAGNRLDDEPTAVWGGERPAGTSLGCWAPVPVSEGGAEDRAAISLITVEVDGCAASREAADPAARAAELEAHADAVMAVFLQAEGGNSA